MTLDPDTCWRALAARDRRFDGLFLVGVATTGVYCRPVCTARTPRRDRCTFFRSAPEAERAGYRACFVCRPEVAPGVARVDALPRLVTGALRRIEAGYLDQASVDELAAELGVTARHLRRAMEEQLGAGPLAIALSGRLARAKRLLHDSRLGVAEIALASGFGSVRRFNSAFRARFGRAPSTVRRDHGADAPASIRLRLDFRPPLAWERLLSFVGARGIPGVEHVVDGTYARTVRLGEATGTVSVREEPGRAWVVAEVSVSLASVLAPLVARLRSLFDLDAQPAIVAAHLGRDPLLRAFLRRIPGLRLPGAFDPFEASVRAVLGQQVSVAAATTLAGRLVERFGAPLPEPSSPALARLFPPAEVLAGATPDTLAGIGLPRARAATLHALATAVASGGLVLAPGADPDATAAALDAIPGIGPWTAQYVVMRALHHPDAFPSADLGVRKALGASGRRAEARAAAWRPWRGYGVMHLWESLGAKEET